MQHTGPSEQVAVVQRWLEEAIIGLKLCPFAGTVYLKEQLRICISDAQTPDESLREVLREVNILLREAPEDLATTLVVFPSTLASFDLFLETLGTLRFILSDVGADGILQIASFHPDYRFADAAEDDVANFTNRSPWPIFHILREEDVSRAVDTHPDAEGIPDRNIQTMQQMGQEAVDALWMQFRPDATKDKE